MKLTMVLYILASWNIIVMLLFGLDKLKAKKQAWRIPEATLILTSFLMGGLGGTYGMILFHHKTSKAKFRILIPVSLIVTLTVFIGGFYFGMWKI